MPDGEIKKSYRKLAIKCHPDKNPHPRSSEAFKILNKAWEVLSDPQKKRIFDQTGSDPTSRINNARFANNPFEDDLFNMFFGGGGGPRGSPFASGPTFTFGGNGFTFQSYGNGGADPQTGPNGEEQPSLFEALKGILPILMLLIVPILSAIFSGDTSPEYSFVPSQEYNIQRNTPKYNIPFYVTDKFQEKHGSKSKRQLRNYDSKVENLFISDKRAKCSKEQIHKDQLIEDAYGWFSVDSEKLQRAENFPTPNCDILKGLNLL
ncbi:hypothetical protein FOB64_006591 [Candida albicans]|uniref:J domain-containing protein n=1 Tax=Candida albicans TaxID=5476 RepID=A0A8H6BU30_CANAX|nr:hypothetical protein FOB64_006591 [Candida albicans]